MKALHILRSVMTISGYDECLFIPDGGSGAQKVSLGVLDRG